MQNDKILTVMVVDDYADIRAMLRVLLEKRGYRVVEAADGKEAIRAAERERPDLVFMDLFMPEVDGFAATVSIRKHPRLRDLPIVALSAYGQLGIATQLRNEALSSGFNDYIAKPFEASQLDEVMNRLLPGGSAPGK